MAFWLPATDGEAMFSLPNAMLGFLTFDRAGKLLSNSDMVTDGRDGWLFQPGDAASLAAVAADAWRDRDELARRGAAARETFERRFTADANYRMLMDVYAFARREPVGRDGAVPAARV